LIVAEVAVHHYRPLGLCTVYIGMGWGTALQMLVEESRLLQVYIFHCLQNNLANLDFSVLLIGVMSIVDEVDSQLSQAMSSLIAASHPGAPPAWA
jgi:hypothetical protein